MILANLSGCLSEEEELEKFPSFNLVDEQGNNHEK